MNLNCTWRANLCGPKATPTHAVPMDEQINQQTNQPRNQPLSCFICATLASHARSCWPPAHYLRKRGSLEVADAPGLHFSNFQFLFSIFRRGTEWLPNREESAATPVGVAWLVLGLANSKSSISQSQCVEGESTPERLAENEAKVSAVLFVGCQGK